MKKKYVNSIYINDETIGIYSYSLVDNSLSKYFNVDMAPGVVEQGYIKNPKQLVRFLKIAFMKIKNRTKELYWIIQDQNILIREFSIEKEELFKKDLDSYIRQLIGNKIRYPFENATYSYRVIEEDTNNIKISMFIADQDLIEDYLDVFNKLGVRFIHYNILSSAINSLYNKENENVLKNSMVVEILNKNITINIIENKNIIFGTMNEYNLNEVSDNFIEDYIDRIANYYQYNLREGKQKISNVIILDASSKKDIDNIIKKVIVNNKSNYKFLNIKTSDLNPNLKDAPKSVSLAYLSSISVLDCKDIPINFVINRPNRKTLVANNLMVLAVTIFALVSLIYIPYVFISNKITNQEQINYSLEIQRDLLLDSSNDNLNNFTSKEIEYNYIYGNLSDKRPFQIFYLETLINDISGNINLLSFNIDKYSKSIQLRLQADEPELLYNYITDIYEEHGITGETINSTRWILEYPDYNFISGNIVEVVIVYA